MTDNMAMQSGEKTVTRGEIDRVVDWLMQQALIDTDLVPITIGCCERLRAAGVPLVRAFFVFSILHPLHSAIGITWMRGTGTTVRDYPHVPGGVSDAYRTSPYAYMATHNLAQLRVDLTNPPDNFAFPVVAELKAEGMTDYIAFGIGLEERQGSGMAGSWATDRAGGFSADDMEALRRVQSRLAVVSKIAVKGELMKNVAETYLGKDAGRRVLDGQIKRGDGQSIEAAIWYGDLRSSTAMADNLPRQDYIDTLNAFFDVAGVAVQEKGGEILSFIGDAMLAIFPIGGAAPGVAHGAAQGTVLGPARACANALDAALDARRRLVELNKARSNAGQPELDCGIALHFGEVMFGNVGTRQRLSFSAFGSAVNEVVRLERLTKEVGEPILASAPFAASALVPWRTVGEFALRGVGQKMNVLTPLANPT